MTQIKQINTEKYGTINAVIARNAATKQSVTEERKIYMENILTTENTENTEKSPANIMGGSEQLKANKIHFQFSTFNFQLIKGYFATLPMMGNALANKSKKSFKSYKSKFRQKREQ
jgi:hypothetical protein